MQEENQNEYTQLDVLQKFNFNETAVLACKAHIGEAIALKPVCENLGLNWSGVHQKINRNSELAQLCVSMKALGTDGKSYQMVCMRPADFQNWLHGLTVTENMNVPLWENYKKGLVIHLLLMLKISLDRIQYLENIANEYAGMKDDVELLLITLDEAAELSKSATEKRKKATDIRGRINDRLKNANPNQLRIL